MRFMFVNGAFPPADKQGGPSVTNYYLAKSLISLGHKALVLTTDINGKERLNVPNYDTEWKGVPVKYCRWLRCPLPYYSPELGIETLKRAKDYDIALISSSWTMYGIDAGNSCRKAGLPYIMYGHGSYDPVRLNRSRLKKKIFWGIFDKKLYNRAAGAIALTNTEKLQMIEMGINVPIGVIPNGVTIENDIKLVDNKKLPWSDLNNRSYILFLGRIEQIKGIDILLDAFSQIHKDFPQHILVIAGPSERGYDNILMQKISQLGLFKSVIFTGAVQGTAKWSLFKNADVFVLSSYGEGLPMTVLEAMASKTPVIITPGCNLHEVEKFNSGLVVEPNSKAIASALFQLLHNSELRKIMGSNGDKLVKEMFSWESVAQQTVEYCIKLLGK